MTLNRLGKAKIVIQANFTALRTAEDRIATKFVNLESQKLAMPNEAPSRTPNGKKDRQAPVPVV